MKFKIYDALTSKSNPTYTNKHAFILILYYIHWQHLMSYLEVLHACTNVKIILMAIYLLFIKD